MLFQNPVLIIHAHIQGLRQISAILKSRAGLVLFEGALWPRRRARAGAGATVRVSGFRSLGELVLVEFKVYSGEFGGLGTRKARGTHEEAMIEAMKPWNQTCELRAALTR